MAVRLLLDENLSERLLQPLHDLFPGSAHVRNLGVWELARSGGFVLATRDEDFVRMSVLRGAPPKVVWLDVGNARNATITALLRARALDVERFSTHEEHTFLAIESATAGRRSDATPSNDDLGLTAPSPGLRNGGQA